MNLWARLTFGYAALLLATLAVFGSVVYLALEQNLVQEIDQRLALRTEQVRWTVWAGDADNLTPADLTATRLDLTPLEQFDAPGLFVQVLDREGRVIAASEALQGGSLPIDPEDVQLALDGRQVISQVEATPLRTLRILSAPLRNNDRTLGVLQVGESLRPVQAALASLRNRLLLVGASALALATSLGWVIAYAGLYPLGVMADDMERIHGSGDFRLRLSGKPRHDEIGELRDSFNSLLAKVEATIRNHRDFVAATSHELRNPLAVIRGNLDLLERTREPEAAAECVEEARDEAKHMTRLVNDLLLLAQVEANQVVELRPLALDEVVRDTVRLVGKLHPDHLFDADGLAAVTVRGDRDRLKQVMTNLLDNAARYNRAGGVIAVTLTLGRTWAELKVRDRGPGIPEEHLPHIFDRFYRIERGRARDRERQGTGLGLAIVRHITEAHGGRVVAANAPGGGAEFTVLLPVAPSAAPSLLRRALPARVTARRS